MPSHRQRPLFIAAAAIVLVWLVCWAGFTIAKRSKMTLERVRQYERAMNLAKLSAAERARALRALVDKLNAMSPEERRRWHLDRNLLEQLTDEEKSWLIDALVPTEMKLALNAFEKMPKERRQKVIEDAMKRMRELSADPEASKNAGDGGPPALSPELEAKVRTIGLNALYSQSSAQTKVELAPLLNEIQNQMEGGPLRRSSK